MSIVFVSVAILAFAVGCGGTQTIDASSGAPRKIEPMYDLVAKSRPVISDMPIPIGYSLDEGRSRTFETGVARYVDHVYKGGSDKFAVARFYKRQMPINRWALVTDMFVQGDVMLDFEKETERCRIIITDGNLFHKTNIKVHLWTTGRIEAPAQEQQE